ncbi:MAG TPA: TrkH family potassium uptake protein [Spirochaetia bacterium]|nr:TrkH family potassium uptake protein [Spirochaetia bacterium]
MTRVFSSEKLVLFGFFTSVILVGSGLLSLPAAWGGLHPLSYLNALFTSASAVCVTGLITVDTAQYTRFGQIVILLLIQTGGLGIISFTTVYLAVPKRKISFRSIHIIKEYYLDTVEYQTNSIVRNIVVATLSIELAGAIMLYFGFRTTVHHALIFTALFHSVSAFCNAGFSTFSNGLGGYTSNPGVSLIVVLLIVLGGIGFVVIQDLWRRASGSQKRLLLHTRVVLISTAVLIMVGLGMYLLLEWNNQFRRLGTGDRIVAALFQSVTTRTAGFNTINEAGMTATSKLFTLILMFIGGASGSTAGGIKVTTTAIIVLAAIRGVRREGEMEMGNRKIGASTIARAHIFAIKALAVLFVCIFLLTLTELHGRQTDVSFLQIVFESFSAFGTVGLSLDTTPHLTELGKIVIIFTMFAGRVGLISFALPGVRKQQSNIHFPEGEVLIG